MLWWLLADKPLWAIGKVKGPGMGVKKLTDDPWTLADFQPSTAAEDEAFHLGYMSFIVSPLPNQQVTDKFFAMCVGGTDDGKTNYLVAKTTIGMVVELFSQQITVRDFFLSKGASLQMVAVGRTLSLCEVKPSDVPSDYFSKRELYWTLSKGREPLRRALN